MALKNQYALLGQRRFAPFFLTQLLGAFNDNIFKNALIMHIAFHGSNLINLSGSVPRRLRRSVSCRLVLRSQTEAQHGWQMMLGFTMFSANLLTNTPPAVGVEG